MSKPNTSKHQKFNEIYNEPLSKKPEGLDTGKQEMTDGTTSELKKPKSTKSDTSTHSKATLFVSTIPFEATSAKLEEFFSDIGPIRSCFIITNKETGKSTGCGYVQYAMAEDAQKALIDLKKKKFMNKRTLKIQTAVRKSVVAKRKEDGISLNLEEEIEKKKLKELERIKRQVKVVPEGPGKLPKGNQLPKNLEKSTTILISNLPVDVTKNVLYKKVRKFGTVNEIILPDVDDTLEPQTARIVYATPQETQKAHKQLNDHTYKGQKITSKIIHTVTAASIAKKARLIVRNLAFLCKKEHLFNVFEVFGKITDCQVPSLPDGKARGFGFVQFQNVDDAAKAIEGVNGQKILNRPVAVDWAIGKTQFDRLNASEALNETVEDATTKDEASSSDAVQDVNEDENKNSNSDGNGSGSESESESGEDNTESADDDSDAEEDVEMEAVQDEDIATGDMEVDEDEVSEDNESDDDAIIYESELESSDVEEDSTVQQKPRKEHIPEVEGCTLFIRNLSFDTTRETLKKAFENWGKVRYALITMDKVTNLSKGNGFVCFEELEDAEACEAAYQTASAQAHMSGFETVSQNDKNREDGHDKKPKSVLAPSLPDSFSEQTKLFVIDGRFVNVTVAVSKQIATKISHSSNMNRRATDKRHLYLMREGVVFPNTEAAALFTPAEMEKRVAQFANRKRLLATNPNLFISRTRLSIRGLGPKVTDSQLRQVSKDSVKEFWEDVKNGLRQPLEAEVIEEEKQEGFSTPSAERKVFVTQSKIIREMDRLDPVTKKPKSKGYGFIEFKSHADALACLRVLNNKPFPLSNKDKDFESTNSKLKRCAVEFAVENRLVLKKRTDRNMDKQKTEKGNKKDFKKTVTKAEKADKPKSKKRKLEDESPSAEKTEATTSSTKKKREFKTFKQRREERKAKHQANLSTPEAVPKVTSKTTTKSNSKDTEVESKKSSKPKSEKPTRREIKKIKKNQDETEFQSMVDTYKKKFLDTTSTEKLDVKKWYE
ncbi:hypothetical protein BC833DRAFT_622115 [Globomyces pollinis-pini]|nr:hypothetical protein BC833DRAFT_622115 [Globomyces pollinis-pini]